MRFGRGIEADRMIYPLHFFGHEFNEYDIAKKLSQIEIDTNNQNI